MENFHTHLPYCGHAEGSALDYLELAQEAKAVALGFSDHGPLPGMAAHGGHMSLKTLHLYIDEVLEAKRQGGGVKVYLGLELDAEPDYLDFYRNEVQAGHRFDYFIGSVHTFYRHGRPYDFFDVNSKAMLDVYVKRLIAAIESKFYAFIGHPDRIGYSEYVTARAQEFSSVWREVAACAALHHVPLEFNTTTFIPGTGNAVPMDAFWRACGDAGAMAVINSDAHRPAHLFRYIKEAKLYLTERGVKHVSLSRNLPWSAEC